MSKLHALPKKVKQNAVYQYAICGCPCYMCYGDYPTSDAIWAQGGYTIKAQQGK